ncbi:hypothetical protein [Selenomonas sp. ND2010]|uniref:hypothetical protein n=1 Tax=Selenomonas sp. ND2010 TaxID=1410618 RepID=UPI00051C46AA|nr:hypothetical protein [Selenomonas sp. ND2010]
MLYGDKEVTNAFSDVETVCEKARALMDQEKYAEAIELLKKEIKKVKKFKVYGFEEYYNFDEMFQFEIFINFLSGKNNAKNKKQRNRAKMGPNIIWRTEPVADLYYYCGYAMVELGEFEQALNTLRMGLEWNPCSMDLRFERINIFRNQGDIENLHRETKDAYKYVFRPKYLARIYRDKGYGFIEEEKWDAAIASYFLSLAFAVDDDDIERANGELGYIEETTGIEIGEPSEEEIVQIAREYKIPIGIDERLLNFAQRRWEQSLQNNDEDGVKYYQEIVEAFSDEA